MGGWRGERLTSVPCLWRTGRPRRRTRHRGQPSRTRYMQGAFRRTSWVVSNGRSESASKTSTRGVKAHLDLGVATCRGGMSALETTEETRRVNPTSRTRGHGPRDAKEGVVQEARCAGPRHDGSATPRTATELDLLTVATRHLACGRGSDANKDGSALAHRRPAGSQVDGAGASADVGLPVY